MNAAVEVAFDLVAADVMAVADDPDKMVGHRRLTDGPLREGCRWQQTVVHNRKLCHTWWSVTEAVRPRVLEQTMRHFCADAERELQGGERDAGRAPQLAALPAGSRNSSVKARGQTRRCR